MIAPAANRCKRLFGAGAGDTIPASSDRGSTDAKTILFSAIRPRCPGVGCRPSGSAVDEFAAQAPLPLRKNSRTRRAVVRGRRAAHLACDARAHPIDGRIRSFVPDNPLVERGGEWTACTASSRPHGSAEKISKPFSSSRIQNRIYVGLGPLDLPYRAGLPTEARLIHERRLVRKRGFEPRPDCSD